MFPTDVCAQDCDISKLIEKIFGVCRDVELVTRNGCVLPIFTKQKKNTI